MTMTHKLLWEFEAHKVDGTTFTFAASNSFDPTCWDDPRDAAIFYTFEDKDALEADGWHIGKPSTIKVYAVRPLSDTALA
jgi:hypothetical protein